LVAPEASHYPTLPTAGVDAANVTTKSALRSWKYALICKIYVNSGDIHRKVQRRGMKLTRLACCLIILVSATLLAQTVRQPLLPASATPGSKGFTLTVNGTAFRSGAVVQWNGSPRLTERISSRELKVTITAADVAKVGTAWVTVVNPGSVASNVVFFPIRQPSSVMAFAQRQVFPGCTSVAVGDFNNDGILDVAWSGPGGVLNVSLGNGKGGFQAPISSGNYGGPTLIPGDFNRDGNLDLASVGANSVQILLGDGHGNLTYKSFISAIGGNNSFAFADFNNDGILDVYLTGWMTIQTWFQINYGNGDGTFGGGSLYYTSYFAGPATIGDFNNDGWLDLLVTELRQGSTDVWLGSSNGFEERGSLPGAGSGAVADMNQDGKLDLVGQCISLGKGDGSFTTGGCEQYSGTPVGVADFNGDGYLDAALAGSQGSSPTLVIALGAGDGTFKNAFQFDAGITTGPGAIGDFNDDGWMDAITSDGFLLLQSTVNLSPAVLAFGDQDVGTTSPPQPATLTNVSSSALPIKSIGIKGANQRDFAQTNNCGTSLPGGSSCQIQVTFTPRQQGQKSASLFVSYAGKGSPQTVSLTGTGIGQPTVSLTPPKLIFSTQLIHTVSAAQPATLANTGSQTVTISSVGTTGPFPESNGCPSTLSPGNNCQISVQFKPVARGPAHGRLSVTDDAKGSPQKVELSGEGTVVRLSPLGINFGDQKVGTKSSPAPVEVINEDNNPVSISSIAFGGADGGDFAETNNCRSTIPPHSHCTVKVTFTPTKQGQRSATLLVNDDGGGSPQTIPLTGTGT
jgi:hypothetical protein